jgi:GntR family transcriptional regulator
MAAIGVTVSDQGRPVETADIVVPAAHCEIVYEIPISR